MDSPFIGQICSFGFNFAPRNWAFCAGALLPISENSTLFSLLGTFYGGDGRTTFGLPDLRGRAGVNQGRHPGSSYDWRMGLAGGAETHTLSVSELATHTHMATFTASGGGEAAAVQASTDVATQDAPTAGCYLAKNDGGRDPGIPIYRADAGAGTVPLGGVSGGSVGGGVVTVHDSGAGRAFPIVQPVLVLNYCIAMNGTYPPRS